MADALKVAEIWMLDSGQELTNIHITETCEPPCPFHHPTNHPMRKWPMYWNDRMVRIERVCDHGFGHTDPDSRGRRDHECDGCCIAVH